MSLEHQGPAPESIQRLFGSIAHGYDRANDWMTFGLAHRWRRQLVEWSRAQSEDSVLDVATGTGDLALEFKKQLGPNSRVVGTDFCEEMLAFAPRKAKGANLDVEFRWADAMALPFADGEFDVVSIAYGIRNVADPIKALRELARVCRPGGRVMVLETGDSPIPFLQSGMKFYFNNIVPRIGGWITGRPDAYQYLSRSSANFPSRERFLELMKKADGLSHLEFRSLMGGASFLYKGTKAV